MLSERRLRKRCWETVRRLRLPDPFSVPALIDSIAAQRGRSLYLHPLDRPDGVPDMPCGMWVATDVADHIFFEQQTSTFHQEHIILHEFGPHDLRPHHRDAQRETLTPTDPAVVRAALGRTSYNTRQEREAEMVASLLLTVAGGSTAISADRTGGSGGRWIRRVNPDTIRLVLVCLCWPVVLLRIPRGPGGRPEPAVVHPGDAGARAHSSADPGDARDPVGDRDSPGGSLISSLLATVVAVLLLVFALRIAAAPGERRWSRVMRPTAGSRRDHGHAVLDRHGQPDSDAGQVPAGARTFTAHTAYWIIYLTYMLIVTSWTTFLFWRQILRVGAKVLRFALFALAVGTTTFLVFLGSRVVACSPRRRRC